MASTTVLLVLGNALLPLLFFFLRAEAGEVGVCYGRIADDLPDPSSVVKLLQKNQITMVRVFDADPKVVKSLANTGIKVSVSLPNELVASAAADPGFAFWWAVCNVKAHYPATLINSVVVGNEVFHQRPDLKMQLVPAMRNVQAALAYLGLAPAVKVTTPVAFDALNVSFPPSAGAFREDIARSVMAPLLDFLDQTGSYFMVTVYPYLAYLENPDKISLDYLLFRPNAGVKDPGSGLTYYSLFDAQIDALYYAIEKVPYSGAHAPGRVLMEGDGGLRMVRGGRPAPRVWAGETGQPSRGHGRVGTPGNAQAYNGNLIRKVVSGRRSASASGHGPLARRTVGTPYRPDADISVYIFALFNEKDKPADERDFGLFYPNEQPVYKIDFVHGGSGAGPVQPSWCVANAAAGNADLQGALDYACSHGADCSAIQPGQPCFQPDNKFAHASYAFNDFYQRSGRANGTCDFGGAATIVFQAPKGACDPDPSWCVANEAVGAERLQNALDYACGHGADCSDIQPGARCFDPDTKAAHASYAFNDFYQRSGRADGTCDFGGAGTIVRQAPRIGNCVLPSKPQLKIK